jgi:hypothetical protein
MPEPARRPARCHRGPSTGLDARAGLRPAAPLPTLPGDPARDRWVEIRSTHPRSPDRCLWADGSPSPARTSRAHPASPGAVPVPPAERAVLVHEPHDVVDGPVPTRPASWRLLPPVFAASALRGLLRALLALH